MTYVWPLPLFAALISGTAALAQKVTYDAYLAGSGRSVLVLKIDTRKMTKGTVITPADFKAIFSNGASSARYQYRIASLRPGEVYEWRKTHGVAGAKSVSIADLAWAARVVGDKADGPSELASLTPTRRLNDVSVSIAMPAIVNTRCATYADTAVRQYQLARQRHCPFSGTRWSSARQYHYDWCTGAPASTAATETAARSQALAGCKP